MKGKAKNKRKVGKAILICIGFFLTIVLTFTTTLAWFYDSDWASKYIQMGGSVGIEIRDGENNITSGGNQLRFAINTDKAYPGQAVDVSASCFNNGGESGAKGSECYVRAHFAVYTNIGKVTMPDPADYGNNTNSQEYLDAVAEAETKAAAEKANLDAQILYTFLETLISAQNANTTEYKWVYYQRTGAMPLSKSGTSTTDIDYYLDGVKYKDSTHGTTSTGATTTTDVTALKDQGYFYLCGDENGVLKPLQVNSSAVFLWNSTFIIPWQLTNASADKYIFVGVTFQAVQTFIPKVVLGTDGNSTGIIDKTFDTDKGNQLDPTACTYNAPAVQTVFNSCVFTGINTKISIDGTVIDFADGNYDIASTKTNP